MITGGTGFLGTHLAATLQNRGDDVVALGSRMADLTVATSLDQFNNIQFDRIFHLAAWTQAGDFCLYHLGEQWLINQAINTNVLTWWQKRQPQALLISMGTSCSYEEGSGLKEEQYLEGSPIPGLYTYGMTKRMLVIGQRSLERQFGLNHLTFVPSTLYGPGYHVHGKQLHFIFDIIRKVLDFKFKGIPVSLWGNGEQRRELVYIEDFVDAMLSLAAERRNDIINIGAGEDHSIREFAEHVCDLVGVPPQEISYDVTKYVGAKSKLLDVAKLNVILPGRKTTPLRDGLAKTVDWLRRSLYA